MRAWPTIDLTLVPVRGGSGVRRFVRARDEIHGDAAYPCWIPPLPVLERDVLSPRHPFYREADRALFLAMRGGRVVGRIAAIHNRAHNRVHGDRTGFFGFFETIRDDAVAVALLGAARAWLAERGLTRMRGPVSPSQNYECGCLVEGHDLPNQFFTPWNPPWYGELLESGGLCGVQDLVATEVPADHRLTELPERFRRIAQRARDRGVSFVGATPFSLPRFTSTLLALYNEAWADTWGFVPLSRAEMVHMALVAPLFVPGYLAFIAVDGNEPVGFLLLLPDYNQVLGGEPGRRRLPGAALRMLRRRQRITAVRAILLGVRPTYRGSSLLPLLLHEAHLRLKERGLDGCEASWLLAGGGLHRAMTAMGRDAIKRWRIYEGDVTA
jgi:GNAT superfamily N-acetyltransferase